MGGPGFKSRPPGAKLYKSGIGDYIYILMDGRYTLMDLKIRFSGGVSIEHNGLSILVDPYRRFDASKYDYVLITHGHTDHFTSAVSKARNLVLTRQTFDILTSIYGLNLKGPPSIVDVGDLLVLDELSIRVLNAGHVIGSAMYVLEFNDISIGITGDFNSEDSLVQRGADAMHDVIY